MAQAMLITANHVGSVMQFRCPCTHAMCHQTRVMWCDYRYLRYLGAFGSDAV